MSPKVYVPSGPNITNNSVYDSWATLAAVDAIQNDYYEITNDDFYDNLINLLSLMPYDSNGNIKSSLANTQAYYKNSLITGQKIWEAEQQRLAEQEAAKDAVKQDALNNLLNLNPRDMKPLDELFFGGNRPKATPKPKDSVFKEVIFGNYYEGDPTVEGSIAKIIIGFTGIDFLADGRDVVHDIQNWEWSWDHVKKTGLDGIGFVPGIGAIKYGDEAIGIISKIFKNGDELADAAGDVAKNAGKSGSSLAENAVDNISGSRSSSMWDMPEGGSVINGREYSQHALERMAPDTPQVRAELSRRAEQAANQLGYQVGSREYYEFCENYVKPRNIPPSVVEDAITSIKAVPGNQAGTFVHETTDVKVVVNSSGKVITVIPK